MVSTWERPSEASLEVAETEHYILNLAQVIGIPPVKSESNAYTYIEHRRNLGGYKI